MTGNYTHRILVKFIISHACLAHKEYNEICLFINAKTQASSTYYTQPLPF